MSYTAILYVYSKVSSIKLNGTYNMISVCRNAAGQLNPVAPLSQHKSLKEAGLLLKNPKAVPVQPVGNENFQHPQWKLSLVTLTKLIQT